MHNSQCTNAYCILHTHKHSHITCINQYKIIRSDWMLENSCSFHILWSLIQSPIHFSHLIRNDFTNSMCFGIFFICYNSISISHFHREILLTFIFTYRVLWHELNEQQVRSNQGIERTYKITNFVKWHRLRQRAGHQYFTYEFVFFSLVLLSFGQSFSGYLPRDFKSKFRFKRRTTRN